MFNIYKRYEQMPALSDISIDINQGELIFITGPSGAGKTTLLKLLYMAETATAGQLLIGGVNLSRIKPSGLYLLRRKFGIIFQDFKLIPSMTVFENVAIVLEASGEKKKVIDSKVSKILRNVGIEDKKNLYPPSLSGGEQQRAAVARAVIGEPDIIIADEPTGSLDPESAKIIMDLLREFNEKGTTLIIATHSQDLIRQSRGRVIRLKKGQLVEDLL
ncbi:MAG: cell division ATP-binding protein FtsE [Desulfobacteraceae bacterium]|nr:cell division ATP-binding protein FtsE [Desulfobacteraceae bacterium]MCB9495020.1 cell division ATP-binding protein FtsE [Desulfobacteraceae bacterium]